MIIVVGQTATGKTKLALDLANKHNGELINFDSRQIYKYLDIITGKDIPKNSEFRIKNIESNYGFYLLPTPYSLQPIKLWLYDIVTPDQYFSSFDFVEAVKPLIEDIIKRGKTPILVGGTYLYLKHFLYGIDYNNSPPNFELRKELDDKSVKELQNILKKISLQSFNRLNHSDQLNPRRLIRKIEVQMFNKENLSTLKRSNVKTFKRSQFKIIGLKYQDKSKLRDAIIKRVEKRLENGAIDEVKKLLKMGYNATDPGIKTIGYQQIIKYLNHEFSKEKMVDDWINKEVQYAKRQLTFMNKDKNIKWKEIV